MLNALLKYQFLQNAVICAILASIACGIIGTIIMEKKLVMISGGIAHTAFGGIGMGYFFNIKPIIGGLFFSLLAALGITTLNKNTHTNTDVLIGMFWSFGMALGLVFVAFTPGYPPDLTSYLFGDILTVLTSDLYIIIFLDLIIIFFTAAYFNLIKVYLFDEEFLNTLGFSVNLLDYLLYIFIAFTVVILIKLVGIILVITLLTAPVSIAKEFSFNLNIIILFSIINGIIFSLLGLWISYLFNIPSGASIVLISIFSYIIIMVFKKTGFCCKKYNY